MGEIIDAREAARRLGVSARTVCNLIRSGKLPGLKVGKEYRLDWGQVLQTLGGKS